MNRPSLCVLAAALIFSGCVSMSRMKKMNDPLTLQEHAALGQAYEEKGDLIEARHEFEAALRRAPHSVPLLNAVGNIAFKEKKWKEAQRYYRRALKEEPLDGVSNNNMALVYLEYGDRPKARQYVQKALAQGGAIVPYAQDTLSKINQGVALQGVSMDDANSPSHVDRYTVTLSAPTIRRAPLKITLKDAYFLPGPAQENKQQGEASYATILIRIEDGSEAKDVELGQDVREWRSKNSVTLSHWRIRATQIVIDRTTQKLEHADIEVQTLEKV